MSARGRGFQHMTKTYFTDGIGAYTDIDLESIITRRSFSILRIVIQSGRVPPLEARFGNQRGKQDGGHI